MTQAQFMLDSESRVQEAIAQVLDDRADGPTPQGPTDEGRMIERIIEWCIRNKALVLIMPRARRRRRRRAMAASRWMRFPICPMCR